MVAALETQVREMIEKTPDLAISELWVVLMSYHQLNAFDTFYLILEKIVCDALESICLAIINKHLAHAKNDNRLQSINDYKTLCRKLTVDTFIKCFLDCCGRIFDVLHCCNKIESAVIQFCDENKGTLTV